MRDIKPNLLSILLISSFFIAFCMKSHLYCYLHTYSGIGSVKYIIRRNREDGLQGNWKKYQEVYSFGKEVMPML